MDESTARLQAVTPLHANPFWLLGVATHATRADVAQAAEEQSLRAPSEDQVSLAKQALLQPRQRLSAFLAWLPGVDAETIRLLMAQVVSGPESAFVHSRLAALAHANLIEAALVRLVALDRLRSVDQITERLLAFARVIARFDLDDITQAINDGQDGSGFPEASRSQVVEALNERHRSYQRTSWMLLERLPSEARPEVLMRLFRTLPATSVDIPVFVFGLVDTYANTRAALTRAHLDYLKSIASRTKDRGILSLNDRDALSRLARDLAWYDSPMWLSAIVQGDDRSQYDELAWELRGAAIGIANERGQYAAAIFILQNLAVAADVGSSWRNKLADDLAILEENVASAPRTAINQREAAAPVVIPQPAVRPFSTSTVTQYANDSWGKEFGAWFLRRVMGYVSLALILLIIGALVAGYDFVRSLAGSNTMSAAHATATIQARRCEGVDTWWDGWQGRVDRNNEIVHSITRYSTYGERLSAQRRIYDLAYEQRQSNPPTAAVSLNDIVESHFRAIAEEITDVSLSESEWDQRFATIRLSEHLEMNSVAKECGITITSAWISFPVNGRLNFALYSRRVSA